MNVLVFTSLFPNNVSPNHGVFVKERMVEVARLDDCKVQVVAPVPYFPPWAGGWRAEYRRVVCEETIDGLRIYHPRYFMIPKIGMALHGLTLFGSVLWFVRKLKRSFDFDVIDAHYVYPDGFAAVLLGRYFGRPVVVSARGSDINQFSKFPLIRRLLQYTLKKSDKVIAVCEALKRAMVGLKIAAEKIVVIPNAVDHKKFFRISKLEARKNLNLPTDKQIILSVGGLIPRKGFDLIIDALKLNQEERRANVFLVIVGEGPERQNLDSLIRSKRLDDHVLLAGAIPHKKLHLWYSAADLFCLASSREGWANVVLESMACGTPVVATDVWGTPEIIRSEAIGLLTKRTASDIAGQINIALNKSWDVEQIVLYSRQYTWHATAVSVYDTLAAVVRQKPIIPAVSITVGEHIS